MFKVPSTIVQDLLLIQELVGVPARAKNANKATAASSSDASSIASSDSDADSEGEVDANLAVAVDTASSGPPTRVASPTDTSDSSDDDSDCDSDSNQLVAKIASAVDDADVDLDDEGEAQSAPTGCSRTRNEIEPQVAIPEFTEVSDSEPLEKVGEIMSIVGNVVVVKGIESAIVDRASERALDSDSLLVFEDRKVLGYVYETFGPTHQPMYQVVFPSPAAINQLIVKPSRTVFHVSGRSKFVFPSQLKTIKGSDASNIHDEEVGVDEAEFSDDEKEVEFKRLRKLRRHGDSRASSVVSSRYSSPVPSQLRDSEVNSQSFYGASPYDEYGPYDMDTAPGPSRPMPLPYDDPYADDSMNPPVDTQPTEMTQGLGRSSDGLRGHIRDRGRGPGRGRGGLHSDVQRNRDGFAGIKRGRPGSKRDGGRFTSMSMTSSVHHHDQNERHSRPTSRSVSPTSLAIASATGYYSGSAYQPQQPYMQTQPYTQPYTATSPMAYAHAQPFQQAYAGVQPHINPRFASAFGIDMNFVMSQQYNPYQAYGFSNSAWEGGDGVSGQSNGRSQHAPAYYSGLSENKDTTSGS